MGPMGCEWDSPSSLIFPHSQVWGEGKRKLFRCQNMVLPMISTSGGAPVEVMFVGL